MDWLGYYVGYMFAFVDVDGVYYAEKNWCITIAKINHGLAFIYQYIGYFVQLQALHHLVGGKEQ